MAKGYVVFTEVIHDRARMDAYVQKAVPTVLEAGGRPIIFHDGPELVEGTGQMSRIVVLEFDSVDAASRWYRSPAYQALVGERQSAGEANVAIVPGFQPAST